MPLTTIDPTPALIIVDLQQGLRARPTVHPFDDVVERSARLAAAFRDHGLPVVLVNATGVAPGRSDAQPAGGALPSLPEGWADLIEELDPQPADIRITKQRWGAFHGTPLQSELDARGVTQVLITGIATSAGVESTARAAHEHGYHVVLVTDAMTDLDPDTHENSLQRIFPRLGETATTSEVLERLETTN